MPDELLAVHGCQNPERTGDVIFVHGLNGNPRDYWCHDGKPENYWPAWLAGDLPGVGVWSLGYENAAFKSRRLTFLRGTGFRGFAMPLTDRAENVLLQLKLDGIGKRPLIFITHSMGGLLVKQLLRTAKDSNDPKWRAVLEQTRGVCFIATPHIGADLAKWGAYFQTLLGTNVSMDELRPHGPALLNLKQWYSNFVSGERADIKTLSFHERKPLPGLGWLVVEPGDADPGVPLTGNYPLGEDHGSICRPKSKNDLIHKAVVSFIVDECIDINKHYYVEKRRAPQKHTPTNPLVQQIWGLLDDKLQDALALAATDAIRSGKDYIATTSFVAALRRLNPGPLPDFFRQLPDGSLPEPTPNDIPAIRSSLDSISSMSPCINSAISNLIPNASTQRKLTSEDMYIDISRFGTGKSTLRLRNHGVTREMVEEIVGQLGWQLIERGPNT